jgi:hypothetical protein
MIEERPGGPGPGKVTPAAWHVAVSAGHLDVLSLLLGHGADVDGRDRLASGRLHFIERRRMEKSKLGNVYYYSIVVQISTLEIVVRTVGPQCVPCGVPRTF